MTLQSGSDYDMHIALPRHRSLEEVVELVISMGMQGADHEQVERALVDEIGLRPDDAALAWDRVHGGIVRASTRRAENCPDPAGDPLAWLSFQRASRAPSIIASLYPQYAEPVRTAGARPWWKFW